MPATMLKQFAKSTLRAVAPKTYGAVMAQRSNRFAQRVLERDGIPALGAAFVKAHGLAVAAGPFRGMQYIDASVGSVYIPKLLGSYECELHAAVEHALTQRYDVLVDVGCAEGYYCVGLAKRLGPATEVFGYDTDAGARAACAQLAGRNGLAGAIMLGAFCDTAELNRVLHGRALIVCDCEGYEAQLLDPAQVPRLADCDLLVELHEQAHPGVTALLTTRFASTHQIELIDTQPRDPGRYPLLNVLPQPMRARAVSEYRGGPQQWAHMTANRRRPG